MDRNNIVNIDSRRISEECQELQERMAKRGEVIKRQRERQDYNMFNPETGESVIVTTQGPDHYPIWSKTHGKFMEVRIDSGDLEKFTRKSLNAYMYLHNVKSIKMKNFEEFVNHIIHNYLKNRYHIDTSRDSLLHISSLIISTYRSYYSNRSDQVLQQKVA